MKGLSHQERRELHGTIARRIRAGENAITVAAEYGVTVEYARRACVNCGVPFRYNDIECRQPDVATKPYAPATNKQSIWDCVNWGRQDKEISLVLSVSRERVRQIRRLRGEKESVNAHSYGVTREFRDWVHKRVDDLHGKTFSKIASEFDKPISIHMVRHVVTLAGVRVAAGTSQYRSLPWDTIDWRLSNADLFEIWGNVAGAQAFSARRSNFRYGAATLVDGPEADSARVTEKQKAIAWFKTLDGKIAKAGSRAYASAS